MRTSLNEAESLISLLRELEWGYFFNWPADNYGRTQLVRYARAAGLDVDVVVRAVWPVLEEAVRTRTPQTVVVEEPIVKIEKIEEPLIRSRPPPSRMTLTISR